MTLELRYHQKPQIRGQSPMHPSCPDGWKKRGKSPGTLCFRLFTSKMTIISSTTWFSSKTNKQKNREIRFYAHDMQPFTSCQHLEEVHDRKPRGGRCVCTEMIKSLREGSVFWLSSSVERWYKVHSTTAADSLSILEEWILLHSKPPRGSWHNVWISANTS